MYEYYIVLVVVVFCILRGLLIFVSFHKHLLVTLLRLEYIILNVFLVLVLGVRWSINESYLLLVFLIFAVTEGRIGLSMLVSLVRRHGGDYLKRINTVW